MALTSDQLNALKFYDPARTRGRKIKFEHVKKWRGDHRECRGHRSGECATPHAWKVMNGTWRIVPDIAIVNIEEGAMTTEQEIGKKGSYPKPVWEMKGWAEENDVEGVEPTEEVKRHLIERLVNMKRIDLEHKKAEYETVEKECVRLRLAAETANGLGVKAKKSDG